MKPEDLKNSINSIKADDYLETRLFAKVREAEKLKRKKRKAFQIAVTAALCCAVFVAGLGIGIPQALIDDTTEFPIAEDININGNIFIMSVRAAESENTEYVSVTDHTVIFPEYKLNKVIIEDDENMTFEEKGDLSLSIKGKNIESVRMQCEKGEFFIFDSDMFEYLCSTNELYDIIVPYSTEYENKTVNERLDIMYKHIENGDYDEYFTEHAKKTYDEYQGADIVYDGNENKIGIGLVSAETYAKFHPTKSNEKGKRNFVRNYTLHNVLEKEEFEAVAIFQPEWYEFLLNHSDIAFSDLPHEVVTIEVTFDNGSVECSKYDFSLNDNGELVIDRITE